MKLMLDAESQPQDARLRANLAIVQLSLASSTIDLGATAIKALHKAKDIAASYQALKAVGGLFSAGAGLIATVSDARDATKFAEQGNTAMTILYGGKVVANGIGSTAFFFASLSYTSPAFTAIAAKYPNSLIASGVGKGLERLLWHRAALMVCGLNFSLIALGVQISIWYFSDDELQIWCSRSAFGWDLANRYSTETVQDTALSQALKDVDNELHNNIRNRNEPTGLSAI